MLCRVAALMAVVMLLAAGTGSKLDSFLGRVMLPPAQATAILSWSFGSHSISVSDHEQSSMDRHMHCSLHLLVACGGRCGAGMHAHSFASSSP
jgi:hypothetical protein